MKLQGLVGLAFTPRPEPLTPCAAYACGASASALVARLLASSDAELSRLSGVSSQRLVLILGEEEALPWVPGVRYLGKEREAPSLLLDTTLAPDLPAHLLARAVQERFVESGSSGPWALLGEPALLVSVASALPLSRKRLQAWQAAFGAELGAEA